jgi:hypothetical protein
MTSSVKEGLLRFETEVYFSFNPLASQGGPELKKPGEIFHRVPGKRLYARII